MRKTYKGLSIYRLVMRERYGNEIIHFSGDDVDLANNPFNKDRVTLKLFLEGEQYLYYDTELPEFKGNPFEFAALHYGVTDTNLYRCLNKELKLNLDERYFKCQNSQDSGQNASRIEPQRPPSEEVKIPEFSYFKPPVSNTNPFKNVSLVEAYNLIRSDSFRKITNELREIKIPDEARKYKALKFSYVTFSGVFLSRKDSGLSRHSGLMTIDFDHIPDVSQLKEKLKNDPCLETKLLFVSPSGDGLKWIISVAIGELTHSEIFRAVEAYIKETYDIVIDKSGKDVSRACFMPCDPDAYINPNVFDGALSEKTFDAKHWLRKVKQFKEIQIQPTHFPANTGDDVEIVIRRIEESCVDITSAYADWVMIGFALAHEFGERGRDYFHRISRIYGSYQHDECDKQYTACLNTSRDKVHINTFFYYAKQAKIDISNPVKKQKEHEPQSVEPEVLPELSVEPVDESQGIQETQEKEKVEDVIPLHPFHDTPRLPEMIHARLPVLLRECCNMFSDAVEKDVILVGALTVISGCLPRYEGKYFRKSYSPHLFSFVTAPAGSGKGILEWAYYLGSSIHEQLVKQSKIEKAEYDRQLSEYNNLPKSQREGASMPIEPKRRKLFVPANCSASAFIQAISENEISIIILETEADTLASSLKQEWGNFCDVLRKGFHHEKASMFRRKENEFIEILNPRIAIMLAGTPKQVQNIMPNVENGLFSRFLFYAYEHHAKFKNPFLEDDGVDLVMYFKEKGDLILRLYETLNSQTQPIEFKLTSRQGELFTEKFEELYERNHLLLASDFNASSLRLGLITFRIAMVLTALRILEDGHISNPLVCNDIDFDTALQIVFTLEKHSIAVYQNLPDNQLKGLRMNFFKALPEGFNKAQALVIAKELEIKERTASKYLTEMKETGLLTHKHNWYTKTSNIGIDIGKGLNNDQADENAQQAA